VSDTVFAVLADSLGERPERLGEGSSRREETRPQVVSTVPTAQIATTRSDVAVGAALAD
jgi:hypothetical protein